MAYRKKSVNCKKMKVFVIHYKKLNERKKHILNQFQKHNIIDYEFIEIDRDELKSQDLTIFDSSYPNFHSAITLSHMYAYKQISEKYDSGLVFEDDVILSEDFTYIFNKCLTQLPEDYDMLFIGNGCNLHIESNKLIHGKFIYSKGLYPTNWGGNGAGRCTDSYLVSKKCAIRLCNYINNLSYKINQPVDWWINRVAIDNNLIVYWSEPTFVKQGTQNGLFNTSYINKI